MVLEALNESITNSNQIIERSSQLDYLTFESKITDPLTHIKAERWYPKTKQLKESSTQIFNYIENLKAGVEREKNLKKSIAIELFRKLINYKKQLMDIDSSIAIAFDTTLIITTKKFDSRQNGENEFTKTFFNGTSSETSTLILSKFQNNIRIAEKRLISFFNNRFTDHGSPDERYGMIVGQNSTIFQTGEKLEITAGVGSFKRAVELEIRINGLRVPVDASGIAFFEFPVSGESGQHFVPVEISCLDREGKKLLISKIVEYTVAAQVKK